MIRHGASHGCATFFSMVFGGLFVYILKQFMPQFLSFLDTPAYFLREKLGLQDMSVELVGTILLATLLAAAWGVAFKIKTTT